MVKTISTWDLNLDKNINYRSLRPILNLLSVSHTPESQLWAAWTLANLTTVNLEEYCEMLEGEGELTVAQEDRYDQNHRTGNEEVIEDLDSSDEEDMFSI